MIKITANLLLYKGSNVCYKPIVSGYRPLFNFVDSMKISGQITLVGQQELYPGQQEEVEILFADRTYIGDDLSRGKKFFFGEGAIFLGEGVVINVQEV